MKYVTVTSFSRCIYLREIPEKYRKGMKLLNPNSGVTSLVFEKDKDTVRIFTKDEIKSTWLSDSIIGLRIGEHIDLIDGTKYKDIHIIDMPKLYPLSGENKKTANEIVKTVQKVVYQPGWNLKDKYDIVSDLYDEVLKLKNGKAKDILLELYDFITNYDPNEFGFDIAVRNFKQTKDGELVLLDPVADSELLKIYRKSKMPKYY